MGTCEEHYTALAQVLAELPLEYSRRYIAGDANAMVRKVDEDSWRAQLGPYIQDEKCNDNGIQMLTFCCREGFCVGNSLFDQSANGSGTYRAPWCREYSKTLDYILVQSDQREEMTACFVWREDELYDLTDHRMVVADIKIRQRGVRDRGTRYDKKTRKPMTIEYKSLKDTAIFHAFDTQLKHTLRDRQVVERLEAIGEGEGRKELL